MENTQTEDSGKIWPGRFTVHAIVNHFPFDGYIYENVKLGLFRTDMSDEEAMLLFLEDLCLDPDGPYMLSNAFDTFTKQQAEELVKYLENYPETKAYMEPATIPSVRQCGVSALPYGEHIDFRKAPDYNLDFTVSAFFDVEHCEQQTPEIDDGFFGFMRRKAALGLINELSEKGIDVLPMLEEMLKNANAGMGVSNA